MGVDNVGVESVGVERVGVEWVGERRVLNLQACGLMGRDDLSFRVKGPRMELRRIRTFG